MNFPIKKLKKGPDDLYEMKNFAPVLTQPFARSQDLYKCYFYTFKEAKGFGVLLSIKFLPCPEILQYVDVRQMSIAQYQKLLSFQTVLYSDLFQISPSDPTDPTDPSDCHISEACYLVVPLKGSYLNWKSIDISLKLIPRASILTIPTARRQKSIVTSKDSLSTFYYIDRITNKTKFEKIFERLPEKSLYSQNIPDEVQAEILEKTLELIKEVKSFKIRNHASMALCKKTKIARRNPKPSNVGKLKPGSLVLIPEEALLIHYLSRKQFRSGISLVKTLIEMERYSFIIEFCQKFQYKGEFQLIRNATTAPIYDNLHNYDALENLGDSVLKVVASLWAYFKFPASGEGFLTDVRTDQIKNKNLASISKRNELVYYIRGFKLKNKCFRPAFYSNKQEKYEKDSIQEKFSDGTLADIVESLTGAFFRSSGFRAASAFLKKLGLFELPDWKHIEKFFGNEYKALCQPEDLAAGRGQSFQELVPRPADLQAVHLSEFSGLETALNYSFKSKSLLVEAFTHSNLSEKVNYERLEFLGDAVLDIIVNSNMFNMGQFTADKLTIFRHMLVNNNILAKLSISLSLANYLRASKETYAEVQRYLTGLDWEEDLLDFGVYNSDPPKVLNDIFEALVGAVLLDSQSLDLTCSVFAPLMKKLMIHLAHHQDICAQNIRSQLSVFGQRTRQKIEVRTSSKNCETVATVLVNGVKRGESIGRTAWLARQNAAKEALEWFKSSSKCKT